MITPANRLADIAPFRVMELLARANELSLQGNDVIHMEVGEPDFPTPTPIVEAAHKALQEGQTKYTDARGIPPLREAISRHYADRFAVDVAPSRIFVTAGASGGLLLLSALLLNPGDNLLMTDPGYPCNRHFLTTFNAEGKLVSVSAADNYQLNPALVDRNWDNATRGLLVASPANPTGAVLSLQDYASLCKSVSKRKGVLIADEIYQGLNYSDDEECTALNVDQDAFIVNSFSKYFGMTGWRLGWLVVPESITKELEKLSQNLFICPSAIAQAAAIEAFGKPAFDVMEEQREEFKKRRDFLVPALRELGFQIETTPAGAFYVYAGLPDHVENSEDFCSRVLEQHFVAITPGTDFGFSSADRFVRISYAQSLPRLIEAVDRLAEAMR